MGIDIAENLKKCQIFTPTSTVEQMLNGIGYRHDIFGKTIIDPACGNGQFLVEILKRFIADGIAQGATVNEIKIAIENCIWGYEIDKNIYKQCIQNLNKTALELTPDIINWSIYCADSLKINYKRKFDFIVENPPYIAYKDLSVETRNETRTNFLSCRKGKFDYSYAFIEKGINSLKEMGKMAVISPSSMFKTLFGGPLREIIKPHLIEIINCENEKIFQNVLTSPVITFYQKGRITDDIEYQLGFKGESRLYNKKELTNKWTFSLPPKGGSRFGDYYRVSNSVATLANSVFIHNVDQNGNVIIDGVIIENDILRVAKSPRYEQFGTKQKIIFPYKYKNGLLERMNPSLLVRDYPNAFNFLESKRNELNNRQKDRSAQWFEFGRSQALRHLNQEKLLISSIITRKVIVYTLKKDEIPYSGLYVVPKDNHSLKNAINILKSKDFYNYIMGIGIRVNGDSVRITSKDVENYRFEE